MNFHKVFHPAKRNSGRLIVDEYQQIKREREQEGICRFCNVQIPLRLMSSHLNICTFGESDETIHHQQNRNMLYEEKMTGSNLLRKNPKIYGSKETFKNEEASGNFRSQINNLKLSKSTHNEKKQNNRKEVNIQNCSLKNFSQKKDRKSVNRNSSETENKMKGKQFSSKKINGKDSRMQQNNNKSLFSQEFKQYFGETKKKVGLSKIKKNPKNLWLESANKKKNEYKQEGIKRQNQFKKREERLKMMKNQAERLKNKQQKILKEIEKQKKEYNRPQVGRNKKLGRPKRENSKKQQKVENRQQSRNKKRNQGNSSRNIPNYNRRQTSQSSYYEQIPVNHPHRTMNFISQTINEQFEMMKEQFQQMNEFFANFVPFSNNGFVYFERGESSDYSIDSDAENAGFESQQQQIGLYDEQIQLLPRYSYIKKLGGDEQCAICISSIKHQEIVRRLPCNHIYHCQCIDQWLRRRAACPVCRQKIGQ